jgi:DNA-directed RNA polymerase subunit RPC12/RpoP
MAEIKIFCLHCGQSIECDEGYRGMQITCPTCNQSLLVPTGHTQTTASIPPRPAPARNTPAIPALWNPQAAAYWSLVFSPIFGSYLHARNAVILGRQEEAKRNRAWFCGSIVFLASIAALSFFTSAAPSFLGLVFFCGWYYDVATKQIKYVKNDLANNYQKKSWTKSLSTFIRGKREGLKPMRKLILPILAFPPSAVSCLPQCSTKRINKDCRRGAKACPRHWRVCWNGQS